MGGTPKRPKQTQEEFKRKGDQNHQNKKQLNAKHLFELNDQKGHFTSQAMPYQEIGLPREIELLNQNQQEKNKKAKTK